MILQILTKNLMTGRQRIGDKVTACSDGVDQ